MSSHPARLNALSQKLKDLGIDALVVHDLINIRYLCGFKGTYGFLIVDTLGATFITDPRYGEIALGMVEGAQIAIQPMTETEKFFADFFRKAGYAQIAFEGTLSIDGFELLKQRVRPSKAKLVKQSKLVTALRAIKDEDEIKLIAKAARIADKAMAAACDAMKPGVRESDIARVIRHAIEDHGGENQSFPCIVASGPNASRPHHSPSSRKLQKGDMVTVDLGALYGGYCSDMTRTPALGKLHPRFETIYNVCLEAQEAALKACTAGAACKEVDAIARDIIDSHGFGAFFGHGLGHCVGLEIHENPRLNKISPAVLEAGHVVTVEPGIYLPGFGGVRIEDLIVVTKGKPRVLSRSPKALTVLPV